MIYKLVNKENGDLVLRTEDKKELRKFILGSVGQWWNMLLLIDEEEEDLEDWIAGRLFEEEQEISTFWSDEELKVVCAMFAGEGRDGFISYPPPEEGKEGFIALHLNIREGAPLEPGSEIPAEEAPRTFKQACELSEFTFVLAFKKKETISVLLRVLQDAYNHWEDYNGTEKS